VAAAPFLTRISVSRRFSLPSRNFRALVSVHPNKG
jgi:hypothetical protein